jgi:hypothetical protein
LLLLDYYQLLDGIYVVQSLIDLIHVSPALHYGSLAFGAFLVFNRGRILPVLRKVHPVVKTGDLKNVLAIF